MYLYTVECIFFHLLCMCVITACVCVCVCMVDSRQVMFLSIFDKRAVRPE